MKTCPIFCFCVFLAACSRENETKPEPVVEVKAAQTEVADLDVTVHAPAAVFPRQQANIASRVTSPIRELRARKGDSVSAGQVLAVLENRDVRAQQQEADRLRAQNQQLLAASRAPARLNSEDDFFARTEDPSAKAQSIACINNLKLIGLSARVWANDDPYDLGRKDVLPPNFLSMSNELSTPKVLVCPADKARKPATSWQEFSPANVSYEFLNPNGSETNPYVLLTRCPVHGHVGLSDGSVQQGSGLGRTFTITIKDGKQIFTPVNPPANTASFE